MKKLLIISRFVPYDTVPHGGGKVHNYNVKKLIQEKQLDVKLITFAKSSEMEKVDHKKYNIASSIINSDKQEKRSMKNIFYRCFPYDKYGNFGERYIKKYLIDELNKLKAEGYTPDVILLEWTQIILFVPDIKKIFSKSKIIGVEHDVTYDKYKAISNKSEIKGIKKYIWKNRAKNLKKAELLGVKLCDLIITLNYKDKELLRNSKVDKPIEVMVPYYYNMGDIKIDLSSKGIMFYGKMDRVENYTSCIWFIKNVMNKLIEKDKNIKLYVVGFNPVKELLALQSPNVIVTGFVDDPKEYFEKCKCLVAPLLSGAGIKIKVLEGMSSGLVVVTNNIGIEGIPAKALKEYIHCESAYEYQKAIIEIMNNEIDCNKLSQNAKSFLNQEFNIEEGYKVLRNAIINI